MALDQGTTSSRCILFDKAGNICSMSQKEFTQIYPQPGWVEHNPMEIWSSQLAVAMECMAMMGASPEQIAAIGEGVRRAYQEVLTPAGMGDVAIYTELGRFMLAPYGCLVTRATHFKHIYKEYVGVDACAANLMRPAMYGAYHHITVMGKEDLPCDHKYDVVGGLCENNDKFAIDRMLPEIQLGDLLVIHDTGAHGFAMGYQYNGRLRSAELLLRPDGSVEQIRRAETPEDYFRTMVFQE